jgi:hypothetical protein
MKRKLLAILCVTFLLLPSICRSDDVIQGKYCYTYGDKESLREAKELTKTLAIRNAIESYRVFLTSTTNVVNFAVTNDILQVIASGYLKNIKVVEHKEDGRTICDAVQATVSPVEIEKVLKREVESRSKRIEGTGIDSSRSLKILRAYSGTEKGEHRVFFVVRALRDLPPYESGWCKNNSFLFVYIDYYDEGGEPINGDRRQVCSMYEGEIRQFSFHHRIPGASYRLWLHKADK